MVIYYSSPRTLIQEKGGSEKAYLPEPGWVRTVVRAWEKARPGDHLGKPSLTPSMDMKGGSTDP